MDFLNVLFPVSGVKTNVLLPPLVSMVISFFTSMGGVSGAFLLLPFQMSVLGYTSPSVSGTNHVFNVVAIPSGVYRYIREGRMAWPLTGVIIAGTLPGVFIGYYLRVRYLPDPKAFKFFVGCVLLFIGTRLVRELFPRGKEDGKDGHSGAKTGEPGERRGARETTGVPAGAVVKTVGFSFRKIEYEFRGERYAFPTAGMFAMALIVGMVGGAYGIGGGAIIAPFCVTFFRLPVYTIAGATLMGTFITSAAGALFFTVMPAASGASTMPDWPLGFLFGIGGFIGMYLGAKTQKYVPQRLIKLILGCGMLLLAGKYILYYS